MTDPYDLIGLGPAALDAYLRAHIAGFAGIDWIEKCGTGQSNPTFIIVTPDRNYVLRTKPQGELLKSAHAVDREFRVMAALRGSDVPVPQVYHLATDEASPTGRAFYVMEHIKGRVFRDPALPDLSKPDRTAAFGAMNAALAALHAVDVEKAGLADYGKAGNYFARQTDRWTRQYLASVLEPDKGMLAIIDWLNAHMPPDDRRVALVHGDWRHDNFIFALDRPEIVAVLDWELSTLGHPFADLAYQCMQWRLPNDGDMPGLGGVDRATYGIPTEAEYVASYCKHAGLTEIPRFSFYLVFAFFRLAAILAGVAAREKAGNASDPETARKYGRIVPQLIALAGGVIGDD